MKPFEKENGIEQSTRNSLFSIVTWIDGTEDLELCKFYRISANNTISIYELKT